MIGKGVFLTVMQLGLLTAIPYGVVNGTLWQWLLALSMYTLYGFVGTAVTMHRLLAHRTFSTGVAFRYFGTFFGTVGSLLSPLEWTQQHVAHHRHMDTVKDPHSPVVLGWRAAFFMFHGRTPSALSVAKLAKEPLMRFLHRWFYVVLGSYITVLWLLGGLNLVVFGWAIPCVATLWGQVLTVMAHDATGAQDRGWLSRLVTFNETKHKYHHQNPGDISQDGVIFWFIQLIRTDKKASTP